MGVRVELAVRPGAKHLSPTNTQADRNAVGALTTEQAEGLRRVTMNAAEQIMRELAMKAADDRAHRIATIAAEELVRSEGEATVAPDEYRIPQCQADDHMMECIQHLKWAGEAMSHETDDGYIVVMFQDLTLSSLAG